MSFVDQEDIFRTVEGLYSKVWKELYGTDLHIPFPRIQLEDAMGRYGTDAPDVRFGLELVDVTDIAYKAPTTRSSRRSCRRKGPSSR